MVLLWDGQLIDASCITADAFCLSALIHIKASNVQFKITTVYGPTSRSLKSAFFAELISHKPPAGTMWISLGDFNHIYRARDKNRQNINTSCINRFSNTLHSCGLKEIHLQNR